MPSGLNAARSIDPNQFAGTKRHGWVLGDALPDFWPIDDVAIRRGLRRWRNDGFSGCGQHTAREKTAGDKHCGEHGTCAGISKVASLPEEHKNLTLRNELYRL